MKIILIVIIVIIIIIFGIYNCIREADKFEEDD
jgi:hypothetical protein